MSDLRVLRKEKNDYPITYESSEGWYESPYQPVLSPSQLFLAHLEFQIPEQQKHFNNINTSIPSNAKQENRF